MTTTNIKAYNQTPYWDDFRKVYSGSSSAGSNGTVESKNYHRILFRPGYAVQARELTQMQTMLQAQIDRHGQYAFKDGSRVVNGEVSLNIDYEYIKLEPSFTYDYGSGSTAYPNATNNLSQYIGTLITGTKGTGNNQVTALVLDAIPASGGDADTLYVKYQKAGEDSTTNPNQPPVQLNTFQEGEPFVSIASVPRHGMVAGGNNVNGSGSNSTIANGVGVGSAASITEGVYFISGCFVYVADSTIILDKYTNNPSYIIGLQVAEDIISSADDETIVDNAQGVPNSSAPGANRYQIQTTLIKEPIDISARTVAEYISLLTIKDGEVLIDKTDKTDDTPLTIRLARRTHDESGDYVVKPFEIEIKEHLNDGSNFGKYLPADGGSADKIALGIEPSTAYVQGYRNHKVGTSYIDIDKPRGADATGFQNEANTQINFGNYIRLTPSTVQGVPDLINFTPIDLKESTTIIGTARVRGMEFFSGEVRLYLFDVNITASGKTFTNVSDVTSQSGASIAFEGTLIAPTAQVPQKRFDVGNNSAVFKLPRTAIKSLADPSRDTTYSIKRLFTATVAGGNLSITTPVGLFEDVNDIIIAPVGAAIKTAVGGNITSGGNGTTGVTFNATAIGGLANGTVCNIVATIKKTIAPKTKTNTTEAKEINVTNGDAPSYDLDRADIIEIVSIIDSANVDHKDSFTLDNGQRDNFYDEGKIIKNSGTASLATGSMIVTFKYYTHGAGDYFCVDSYPSADYATIPTFAATSGNLELRDCIDFRPTKSGTANIFTGTGLSGAPKVGHALTADIKYYLPRIDKLVLKRDGAFEVVKGVPSEYPRPPADKEDGLTLYQLKLKPYIFSLTDIYPEIQDNRRYTMRDIAGLDKRIKNMEYYTSLSLLEQSAASVHMVDGSGLSRFKNGILVDSFKDQKVADMAHPECSESVDKKNGLLRPECPSKNVNLITKTTANNTAQKSTSLWTLPYSSVAHTIQPYASVAINVNPYNVFSWAGRVQLSPESDEWLETEVRPDVIIDDTGQYDQFVIRAEEDGVLGTVWNNWETNWSGQQVEVFVEPPMNGNISNGGFIEREEPQQFRQTTITTTTASSNQTRTGLQTSVGFDTVTKEASNKVVEINFIPFMRSRKVYFKASRMKPNTKVNAFFNDINVTAYCKQAAYQEWSDTTAVVEYSGATAHPDSGSGTLTTNNKGQIEGEFIIPRNDSVKFKAGTKEFRLSDSTTNDQQTEVTSAETSFHAAGLIESTERTIISTKVPRLETIRVNESRVISETFSSRATTWVDPLAQSILIEKSGGIFATSIDLYFQTKYAIKDEGGSDNVEIPVCVSIVATENGIPTQIVVPGTEVELMPAAVNISATASTATNFAFEHPVYLMQDQEYAIVIQSDCDEYMVWVAEMGGNDVTDTSYRINKQPHGGSFFTSQNASTWTPDQSKDLKFTLNRAEFGTAPVTKEVTFVNDTIPVKKLSVDAISTTNGSGVMTVRHKNHGMHGSNSSVKIAGATGFNGIIADNINGTHTIANIKHDSYTITAENSQTATSAGAGGGALITASENRHYDLLHMVGGTTVFPETDIRFYLTSTTQRSINGTETAYAQDAEVEILSNMNQFFTTPRLIASEENESGSAKTFTIRAVLSSNKSHLTPVLDQNRLSATVVQNIIGDNGVTSETNAYGGSELCKYITKRVNLASEAQVIDLYLSANRPAGSNIDVYYRTVESGTDVNFNEIDWTLALPENVIPTNDNNNVYTESKYEITPSTAFGSMAFKIILRSKNSSRPPTVKDFRAIAAI